jgi:PAT family beta-lactamase induction signal transducer AmpG
MVTGQTLGAWLTHEGLSLSAIGAFAAVGLPYTFKWAWAPLLDRFALPFLGRRRGWAFVLQLGVAAGIALMAFTPPRESPLLLAALAIVVAFLSASLDVVLDAYKTDRLAPEDRAAGAAAFVFGYRAAVVVSGFGALVVADLVPWPVVYLGFAALELLLVGALFLVDEPPTQPVGFAVWDPLRALLAASVGLLFVALYKFGDHLAQPMLIPFFSRGPGFSQTEIGLVSQIVGLAGVGAGGWLAVVGTRGLGLRRALLYFGILQAATNGLYALLAVSGKSLPLFGVAIFFDQLANAMGTAAFVAYLMGLCDPRWSATQYAILTSLSSVGQRVFGFLGGPIVGAIGWPGFFGVTGLVALPGLFVLLALRIKDPGRASA